MSSLNEFVLFVSSVPVFGKLSQFFLFTILFSTLIWKWTIGNQKHACTKQKRKEREKWQEIESDLEQDERDTSQDAELEAMELCALRKRFDDFQIPYSRERLTNDEMIAKSIEFYEMMKKRRSIRSFTSEPIPRECIENIILAAGTAPSGIHTQPWTYVIVSDPEVKLRIREIVEREEEINYKRRMGTQWVFDLLKLQTDWNKPYLTEAPHIILVFRQIYGISEDGKRKTHYYSTISVSASVGLATAAIENAGLCTVVTTPINCGPALRALVNRPENEKFFVLLPVGHPRDAIVPDFKRKELSEIMVNI